MCLVLLARERQGVAGGVEFSALGEGQVASGCAEREAWGGYPRGSIQSTLGDRSLDSAEGWSWGHGFGRWPHRGDSWHGQGGWSFGRREWDERAEAYLGQTLTVQYQISKLTQQFIPPLLPPWYPYVCSLCLCLDFCFANKFICTIFIVSTHMH